MLVPQYGVSGYRLDFAVQHPDEPGCFVLAIEADGAAYHASDTARDRDRIRQEHLERLGWRFHRIWSTEWLHNREKEIELAVEAYHRALAALSSGVSTPVTSTSEDSAVPTSTPPLPSAEGFLGPPEKVSRGQCAPQ
ncbi:DUF559 domain-containing protein [Cyanobium sp. NIES-981]|uniref:DUF559 domain-containing protein n=1 Tax=Cyanobium sp. NIES-981 TaxID=1851505 RepID=UPI0035105695